MRHDLLLGQGRLAVLAAPGFAAEQTARWADTELFRTTVALNFRPEALAAQTDDPDTLAGLVR